METNTAPPFRTPPPVSWMAAANPAGILRMQRENGWLRQHMPEVNALYGIPQTAQWHPEVDTGIHIEMCMEAVSKLTDDPAIRWAVLVHDVGKGLTPADILPKHTMHEKTGLPLITALCDRFTVPDTWRTLAMFNGEQHINIHRIAELRPGMLVTLLDKEGLGRSEYLVEALGIACQADKQGRLGLETQPYPQRDLLRSAAKAYRLGVAANLERWQICDAVADVLRAHAYHVDVEKTTQFLHRVPA